MQPNTRYSGCLFAKSDSESPLPVKIALVSDRTGQILANASVAIAGTGRKRYEFETQSGSVAASSTNHLELTPDQKATVWLQMVSLFPPT